LFPRSRLLFLQLNQPGLAQSTLTLLSKTAETYSLIHNWPELPDFWSFILASTRANLSNLTACTLRQVEL